MRICLLTNQDLDAVPFPADDWPCDPRPFLPEAEWEVAVLTKATSVERVRACVARGHDVYFNLCDGAEGEDKPGLEVVQTLEALDVPFTGADSTCYEPTRDAMQAACRRAGVGAPEGRVVRTPEDVEQAARSLRFPLFVKHHNSYSSVSLSRASRVATPAGLRRQARKIVRLHGAARVEEYVPGTECTVLVAEHPDAGAAPTAFTPIRYEFPPGEHFKHARLKWETYQGMRALPVEDADLAARLRADAVAFFLSLGSVSYGRCDVRVDPEGRIFMLEMNPNCGLYYPPADAGSADLCLLHDPAGHAGFTRQVVAAALARHARRHAARR